MENSQSNAKDLFLEAGPHGVLVLHGLGSNFLEVAGLARHLNENGFTVHVPVVSGYSFGANDDDSTCAQWVDSAEQSYWKLKERCETVSVVGLSMGATLALMLTTRVRPTCSVFLSTCLAYDGWAIPWYSFLLRVAPCLPFLKRYKFSESEPYGLKNSDRRSKVKKSLETKEIADIGAHSLNYQQLSQGIALMDTTWKALPLVETPALFVHSVDDETAHPKRVVWAMKEISSPIKRLHQLGNCYHMITVDLEKEAVYQETTRFIKQQVNDVLEDPAFEFSPVILQELKNYLRHNSI